MAQNEVSVKLTVEEQQAINAISKIINATDKLERETVKSGKKMDRAFSSFAGNLAAIAASKAISGITNSIGGLVDAASDLEVFETQFKTILGSSAAAQAQLEELQHFAASTPFQLPGLALSTRQLLSFGVAQKDVIPTLKNLGDLAAGAGAQIDELTIPFGRLISTQKLTLVELDKFADRGINIYQELANQTGISIKDIRDNISKGKVPFEEFTKAIENLTGPQGKFFNGMKSQSQTLAGVLSTLQDNFFNLQGEIGKAFKPALISSATAITEVLKGMADTFAQNGPQMAKTFSAIASFLVVEPAKFWTDFFGGESAANSAGAVQQEMESLKLTIDEISARINENKDSTLYNSIFGKKEQDLEEMAAAMERLGELETMVDERRARELEKENFQIQEKQKLKQKEIKLQKQNLDEFRKAEDAYHKIQEKQRTERRKLELKQEADFWSAALSLQSSGNKTAAAIGKGFALTQLAIKTPEAVANSFAFGTRTGGPILGAVLGGVAAAAMAAQAAKIAGISGFATGGVVGSFNGASLGADNQIASVRTGEMILNAQDQKTLFTEIKSGNLGSGNGEMIQALLNQPIIVEIDNKEVARAYRSAVSDGFVA